MIDILVIRNLCRDETISATKHFADRLIQRKIRYDDVLMVIMNGEIVEEYPTAYPYPCALFLGYSCCDKPLHVVAGTDGSELWLITAYYPNIDQWDNDFKLRRAAD